MGANRLISARPRAYASIPSAIDAQDERHGARDTLRLLRMPVRQTRRRMETLDHVRVCSPQSPSDSTCRPTQRTPSASLAACGQLVRSVALRLRRQPGNKATHRAATHATSRFKNIEWLLADGGSIDVGRVGSVDCVASAADRDVCHAMLARRKGETLLKLLGRLDRSIAIAAETSEPIDEINGP